MIIDGLKMLRLLSQENSDRFHLPANIPNAREHVRKGGPISAVNFIERRIYVIYLGMN